MLGAGSGNALALKGTAGNDDAVLTAAQATLNGSAPIAYGNVAFFTFDLGTGENSLLIDHATLNLHQDAAISAGTKVTVDGGVLNFNGHADAIGDLTLIDNGQANVTALSNTITTVASGTLTATSIVCDTLIIGSSPGAANAASTFVVAEPPSLQAASQLSTKKTRRQPPLPSRHSFPPEPQAPPIASSALPVITPAISSPEIASPARLPEQTARRNSESFITQLMPEKPASWLNARPYTASRFDDRTYTSIFQPISNDRSVKKMR